MALMMDRESKKRRFNLNLNDIETDNINTNTDTDTDTDTDDVKMDKFFAIIRSAKDIRDQLLGIEPTRITAKRLVEPTPTTIAATELKSAVWMPSFRPEDFGGNDVDKSDLLVVPSKKPDEDGSNKDAHVRKLDNTNNNNNNNTSDNNNSNATRGGFLLDLNLSL